MSLLEEQPFTEFTEHFTMDTMVLAHPELADKIATLHLADHRLQTQNNNPLKKERKLCFFIH